MVNPDDLILRVNISHAERWGCGFDAAYAAGLSADAVPALAASLPTLKPEGRFTMADALLSRWPLNARTDWRTWNRSRSEAQEIVRRNVTGLRAVTCAQREREDSVPQPSVAVVENRNEE